MDNPTYTDISLEPKSGNEELPVINNPNYDVSFKLNGEATVASKTDIDVVAVGKNCKTVNYDKASVISLRSEDEPVSMNFGWFGCEPKWLQCINTVVFYSALMTLVNIFQSGTTNGLMGAVQSSIETRYQLTSKQSSWIVITYELATVPLAIWVMYVGTVGIHRPRWTAAFLMVSMVGCLAYALPQFTTPVYSVGGGGGQGEQTCGANITYCDEEDEEKTSLQVRKTLLGEIKKTSICSQSSV